MDTGPDPTASDLTSGDPRRRRRGGRGSSIAAATLLGLMAFTGILAAVSITPDRDDPLPPRPEAADVVLAAGAPRSWDPARIVDADSAQVVSQVFEGLTVLDAQDTLRPALASEWQLGEGGRRVTFQLRPGITFSDGTPITAEDVRRSWLRVIEPSDPSPLASLLDDVRGARAHREGTGRAEDVGIRADGDRVHVDLERPAAWFPAIAAVPSLAVVPERFDVGPVRGMLPASMPVSGAYRPVASDAGVMRLEANPRYWAGTAPLVDVALLVDDGGRSGVDAFQDGSLDWTAVSAGDAAWIQFDHELGPSLRRTDLLSVEYLGFDTSDPPFDDARVRRAVGMAVDWRRLAMVAGADGPAPRSLVPPGIGGAGDADFLPPYDPERARAELTAAGHSGGAGIPVLRLGTYGVGPVAAIAEELQRELGLDVVVEQRPFDEHSALLDRDPPDLWTQAWSADYPHADDFLGLLLRSESSANPGRWADAAFDALVDAAAATDDPDEQARRYAEAQVIVRDEVPVIPLRHPQTWSLSRDRLLGAQVSGSGILRYAGLAWAP